MKKLVLGIAVSMFFGYTNSASSSHLQGYCEQGLYIPTHVIECVAFCADRDKVFTLSSTRHPADIRECECADGSIKHILPDPQSLQCPKVQCGVECNE